ncbi:GntR family transcriptional regulator [Microbacterium resistens]|uniref:GntR family transcriptional regulator n=1 Tax=Microbacterium resistens TaxID=156977 RepID=UPI0036714DFC
MIFMTGDGDTSARGILPERRALVDDVHDVILGFLMDRAIEPGARVNIDAVARDLDVSPTPVREALTRLEAEGLVVKRTLRGYVASPLLDEAGLRDLYEMRALLEPEAARRAAERVDEVTVAELFASVERLDASSAPGTDEQFHTYRRFIDEDRHFHHLIAERAGSPLLSEAIVRLRAHLHLYRLDFRHDFEDRTVAEHAVVVEALRQHDAKAAALAMLTHITNSYARLGPALSHAEGTQSRR